MRRFKNILITLMALLAQMIPAQSNSDSLLSNYQAQDLISANSNSIYLAANPSEYDEESDWEYED
jgi:hypothetical protein